MGGGSLANVVNRIFHRILDDEVAQHFCFRGQNAGKRAFEHLGTCKLIEGICVILINKLVSPVNKTFF